MWVILLSVSPSFSGRDSYGDVSGSGSGRNCISNSHSNDIIVVKHQEL